MNENQLLDVIGEAQNKHIVSAIRTKSGKPETRKTLHFSRRMLIAAAIICLLTVTAFAAEYVGGLFVAYFQEGRGELSDSQIGYIENNVQPGIGASQAIQAADGYQVQVRSALTDGKVAYVTVDIQAPEGADLKGKLAFEDPRLFPDQANGLTLAPDGSSPDALSDCTVIGDSDGLAHTASVVFKITPFAEDESAKPFDGTIQWHMVLDGLRKTVFGEEIETTHLSDGVWEFDLEFKQIETREVEFVSEPIAMKASPWLEDSYTIDCQIVSFKLSGLGHRLEFTTEDPANQRDTDIGDIAIVMKDGTQLMLLRVCNTITGSAPLSVPIVLDEVDHILFRDGTKLYPK